MLSGNAGASKLKTRIWIQLILTWITPLFDQLGHRSVDDLHLPRVDGRILALGVPLRCPLPSGRA